MAVSPSPCSKRKAASALDPANASAERPVGATVDSAAPRRRKKDPGVRVIGGRIYDSQNGKTCHQCRQKTMDFVAPCKSERNGKPCPIRFCHKCLLNRYGEKAEEVATLEKWSCPKCRGDCNCSFCMKKKGLEPTGILVRTAKAVGFNSVSDLLHNKSPEDVKEIVASTAKLPVSSVRSGKKDEKKKASHLVVEESELEIEPLQTDKGTKVNVKRRRKKASTIETCADVGHGEIHVKIENGSEDGGMVHSQVVNDTSKNNDQKKGKDEKAEKEIKKPKKLKKQKLEKMNAGAEIGKIAAEEVKKPKKLNKKVEKMVMAVENGEIDAQQEIKKPKKLKKEKVVEKENRVENGKNDGGNTKTNEGTETILKCLKLVTRMNRKTTDLRIPLPEGNTLTTISGIDLKAQDVGPVLQFLEFCAAFEKVLGIKKGHAETVLRELYRGPVGRRGLQPSVAQFHIKLLSLILKDIGEKPPSSSAANEGSWLQAFEKCIDGSQNILKELPIGLFSKGLSGYNSLDFSEKLRLLNFLCDETLSTDEMRSWIEEENIRFVSMKKEDKKNNHAAKEKKKTIKQKLKNELAQILLSLRTSAPLTVSDHENLVSEIKGKTEQIRAQIQDSTGFQPKKKQRSDGVRTEPALLEGSGHAFWRLKCCDGGSGVLLQDVGSWEALLEKDKWFTYDGEQQKVVEKHIMLVRKTKVKRIRRLMRQDRSLVNSKDALDIPLENLS